MNSKIKALKAKTIPLALCGAMLLGGSPMIVNAADTTDVTIRPAGESSQNVTATFTIDNDTLVDLGYGAIASIPITVPLSYNSSDKAFEGERQVYCAGVIGDGKKVTVNVDTISTDLGKIVDDQNNEYNVSTAEGFAVNLSRTEWSQSEMASNLAKKNAGNFDNMIASTLSVTIPGRGFVPKVTGSFESKIPLLIRQVTV